MLLELKQIDDFPWNFTKQTFRNYSKGVLPEHFANKGLSLQATSPYSGPEKTLGDLNYSLIGCQSVAM